MSETAKRFDDRLASGFFLKYIQNLGVDIGCGTDPVSNEVEKWDKELGNGDATYMEGVPDNHFDFVYSYHCLEHLDLPETALRNWWRILKKDGWLIIGVPHRDLYEKKSILPSRWNADHKNFFMPVWDEKPHTLGLLSCIWRALGERVNVHSLRVFDDDNDNQHTPNEHANGEYTIEVILRK